MKLPHVSILCVAALAAFVKAESLPVLIIDGQNNHDWKSTTPVLKKELEETGRFTASVFTASTADSWKKFPPVFNNYRAIVLNYNGAAWPDQVWSGFESYMKNGGGLVVIHGALATFPENEAFGRMIALGWRQGSGHGARVPFQVDTQMADHSIMKSFPKQWPQAADEIYHSLKGPRANQQILATAHSPETRIDEPMLWTVAYEKGRVFCTTLGHDKQAMASNGFRDSFTRGTEWAATGEVSPSPAPQKDTKGARTGNGLDRATIERHIDQNVMVSGAYAPIKLPLLKGIPLHNPTRIVSTPQGVFVANYTGEILRLKDTDRDGLEDTTVLFSNIATIGLPAGQLPPVLGEVPGGPGLRYPTGLAYKDGWLYVGATQEIHRFEIKPDGSCGKDETFAKGWPFTMHPFDWTFGLKFSKDGWLHAILCTDYLNPKAAPDPDGLRGSMIRISPDGKTIERFASGLRFAYGIAINETGDVFFTDNKGGENAVEELNHAVKDGNYGHHPKKPASPPHGPIVSIKSEASPNGCEFNPSSNTRFGDTAGDLFIACWGNDGRWDKGGIARVRLNRKADGEFEGAEELFSRGPAKVSDLTFSAAGDMYVARFGQEGPSMHAPFAKPTGDVYRYVYAPWKQPPPQVNPLLVQPGDPAKGQKVFNERACVTCHSTDGGSSLLGPDLRDIGLTMDRAGLRESIENPAANIKTDFDTVKLTAIDGSEMLGRIVSTDEEAVVFMTPGNIKTSFPRSRIRSTEIQPGTLMPPGLATGLSEASMNDLFSYIESLGRDTAARIHSGGATIRVGDKTYLSDVAYKKGGYGFVGGKVSTVKAQPAISSSRFGDFSYRFDAPDAEYEVTLTFGETWATRAGQRVFSVLANGKEVIRDLDVFKEAGASAPLERTFRPHSSGGALILNFKASVNQPMVSLIEVKPVATMR